MSGYAGNAVRPICGESGESCARLWAGMRLLGGRGGYRDQGRPLDRSILEKPWRQKFLRPPRGLPWPACPLACGMPAPGHRHRLAGRKTSRRRPAGRSSPPNRVIPSEPSCGRARHPRSPPGGDSILADWRTFPRRSIPRGLISRRSGTKEASACSARSEAIGWVVVGSRRRRIRTTQRRSGFSRMDPRRGPTFPLQPSRRPSVRPRATG